MTRFILFLFALFVMVDSSVVQVRKAEASGKTVKFQPPPPPDAPNRRPRGTASRGRCANPSSTGLAEPTLTLIVPESNWGLTNRDLPTLWATVTYPQGKAEAVTAGEYELDVRPMDASLKLIRFPVQLPHTSGTFQIPFPFALQPNQGYRLYLIQKCDAQISVVPEIILFESFIQRLGPTALDVPKVSKERVAFYAAQGVWFDAFNEAAQLACNRPLNGGVADAWQVLLKDHTVNLGDITQAPLLCKP